jgi:hypothetical protein
LHALLVQTGKPMSGAAARFQRSIVVHAVGACELLRREVRLGVQRLDAAGLDHSPLDHAVEVDYADTLPALHYVPQTDVDAARALGQWVERERQRRIGQTQIGAMPISANKK